MSTRIARLFAAALVVGVVLVPAPAWAGCSLSFSPSPGWLGASVTVSGTGLAANNTYYVNVDGKQIGTGPTNANGAFSFTWNIPNSHPTGTFNTFMQDGPAECNFNGSYTVNASPPPPPTTTTTTTTTTTLPPTTTLATTTTVAPTTTKAPTTTMATTTSSVDDTTTTTIVESSDNGGLDPIVIVLIVLVVLLAVGLAFALARIRRS